MRQSVPATIPRPPGDPRSPAMSEPTPDLPTVEALAEEYLARLRDGERPTTEEYALRFPELADEIRDFFPALGLVEHFKPRSGGNTGSFFGASIAGVAAPDRLGEYHIVREVGRGGMGVVYEAEQESLGPRV